MFDGLYWYQPLAWWLIALPVPIMLVSAYWQKKQWRKLVDTHLMAWAKAHTNTAKVGTKLLLLVTWCFLVIAIAGPRTIYQLPPALNKNQSEIVFVVDFSQSMNARDVAPNRLNKAIDIILNVSKKSKLKMGLMVFSGRAHWLIKPTIDSNLFYHFAKQLKTIRVPTLGNNLTQALSLSAQAFDRTIKNKYIVLLTDGDIETVEQQKVKKFIAKHLNKQNINLSIIGIGGIELVNIPSQQNQYVKQNGQRVLSRLQSAWLKKLPNSHYYSVESIATLSLKKLIQLPQLTLSNKQKQTILWAEWFYIPLLFAMLSLLAVLYYQNKESDNES